MGEKVLQLDMGNVTEVLYKMNLVSIPVISEEIAKKQGLIYNISQNIIWGVYKYLEETDEILPLIINDANSMHFNEDWMDIVIDRTNTICPGLDGYINEFKGAISSINDERKTTPDKVVLASMRIQYILETIKNDILVGIKEGRGKYRARKIDTEVMPAGIDTVDMMIDSTLDHLPEFTPEDLMQKLGIIANSPELIIYEDMDDKSRVNMVSVILRVIPSMGEDADNDNYSLARLLARQSDLPDLYAEWIDSNEDTIQNLFYWHYQASRAICRFAIYIVGATYHYDLKENIDMLLCKAKYFDERGKFIVDMKEIMQQVKICADKLRVNNENIDGYLKDHIINPINKSPFLQSFVGSIQTIDGMIDSVIAKWYTDKIKYYDD